MQNQTYNTNNQAPLFELRQRKYDGKWEVVVTKSEVELGIITREVWEAMGGYAWLNQNLHVVAAVYDHKPSVDTVLALLGVKRRERADNTRNGNTRNGNTRNGNGQNQRGRNNGRPANAKTPAKAVAA